jgi:hypothetical protein
LVTVAFRNDRHPVGPSTTFGTWPIAVTCNGIRAATTFIVH